MSEQGEKKEVVRLSPSIAKTLINRSPLHAWAEHRLLGGKKKEATKEMGEGKLIEALLFGLPMDEFVMVPFDNFTTKAAREARDAALLEGKTPITQAQMDKYMEAVQPMIESLASKGINMESGKKQVRLEWQSLNPQAPGLGAGVACSGVLDQLILDEPKRIAVIRDLKTTDNAHPRRIQRMATDLGYDIQAAAYMEALGELYPWTAGRTVFEFVYVERDFPHAVTVARVAGSMLEMGQRKWRRAVESWGRYLASNHWPDYSVGHVMLEALPWQLTQEMEQEMEEQEVKP